jgi:hypothetical protein
MQFSIYWLRFSHGRYLETGCEFETLTSKLKILQVLVTVCYQLITCKIVTIQNMRVHSATMFVCNYLGRMEKSL